MKTLQSPSSSTLAALLSLEDSIAESMEPTQQDLDECERLVQSLDLIELLQSEEE